MRGVHKMRHETIEEKSDLYHFDTVLKRQVKAIFQILFRENLLRNYNELKEVEGKYFLCHMVNKIR